MQHPNSISPARLIVASHILATAALLSVLLLHLLSALLAGLLVYSLVTSLIPVLQRHLPGTRADWFVIAMLAASVVGIFTLIILAAIAFLNSEHGNPTLLFERVTPLIERARTQLPTVIVNYLPTTTEDIRTIVMDWLREHTSQLQLAGKQAARVIVQLLIGIVLGAMLALYRARPFEPSGPLTVVLGTRAVNLVIAFKDVVYAQVKISALNTLLTGIFLLVVLPSFGVYMPLAKTLVVATFVVGLLPVIGNLISNTLIFVMGLSISLWVAIAALAFLVVIHKLEYFLNARIIGTQIRARAWELLIAMLFMESIFGVPGLIAAPIYYAYLKRELEAARLI